MKEWKIETRELPSINNVSIKYQYLRIYCLQEIKNPEGFTDISFEAQIEDNFRFYVSCFDVFNVLHRIFVRILMQE
jgi:hypothetical protein